MKMNIQEITGKDVLSGAIHGKELFAALLAQAPSEPEEPSPLFLDFNGIEIATASYLREAVANLKAYYRATESKHYPVLVNPNEQVEEEMAVVMEARKDAIVVCDFEHDEGFLNLRLLGILDAKQAVTFDMVTELSGADAGTLMNKFGEEEKTTSTTAWNNRLSGLAQKGLLREFSRGRAKFYRPLVEVIR